MLETVPLRQRWLMLRLPLHIRLRRGTSPAPRGSLALAKALLRERYQIDPETVQPLAGWRKAQAFGFDSPDGPRVLRLRSDPDPASSEKDRLAAARYASARLPIPRVLEVGGLSQGGCFCVTERAPGVAIGYQDPVASPALAGAIVEALLEVHLAAIPRTARPGEWGSLGPDRGFESWPEFVRWRVARDRRGWERLLEGPLARLLTRQITELLPFLPDVRRLVHGDFGMDNLIARDSHVTGVIDWERSLYGDFVYDIAYLDFWGSGSGFAGRCRERFAGTGLDLSHYEERIQCYQAIIGLSSLVTTLKLGIASSYVWTKSRLGEKVDALRTAERRPPRAVPGTGRPARR